MEAQLSQKCSQLRHQQQQDREAAATEQSGLASQLKQIGAQFEMMQQRVQKQAQLIQMQSEAAHAAAKQMRLLGEQVQALQNQMAVQKRAVAGPDAAQVQQMQQVHALQQKQARQLQGAGQQLCGLQEKVVALAEGLQAARKEAGSAAARAKQEGVRVAARVTWLEEASAGSMAKIMSLGESCRPGIPWRRGGLSIATPVAIRLCSTRAG